MVADCLSCIHHEDGTKLVDDTFPDEHLFVVSIQTPWFTNIVNYLATGKLPNHFSPHEKHHIIVHISNYSWVDNDLFRTGLDIIIRRCVREYGMVDILHGCHDGPCGGNFSDKRMTYKLLHSGYYWPRIFKDAAVGDIYPPCTLNLVNLALLNHYPKFY